MRGYINAAVPCVRCLKNYIQHYRRLGKSTDNAGLCLAVSTAYVTCLHFLSTEHLRIKFDLRGVLNLVT